MSEHAISNARSWSETIRNVMAAYAQINGGEAESVIYDGDEFEDADTLRERILEMPLSVQVRTGWHAPGDNDGFDAKPEEFEILLSTGGPALRLIGQLDGYGQVHGQPVLQWQDWGTPWTDYYGETADDNNAADEALAAFAGCFWFGE